LETPCDAYKCQRAKRRGRRVSSSRKVGRSHCTMRVLSLLLCAGLGAAALVKREAEPEAEAEAEAEAGGYQHHGGEQLVRNCILSGNFRFCGLTHCPCPLGRPMPGRYYGENLPLTK
jgi:hypothetical protein